MLLLVQLAFGVAVVLTPGALVARALGVRRLSAALAWSLAVVFGALVVTFAVSASLDLTLALLLATGIAAIPFVADATSSGSPLTRNSPMADGRNRANSIVSGRLCRACANCRSCCETTAAPRLSKT